MGRILAVDYGTKRVGLAVTDPLQIIATGLVTIHSKDVIAFIKDYIEKEVVDCVVVGEPKTLMNKDSNNARYTNSFVNQLKKALPELKIERYDERFTSYMAHQTMLDGGLKKKDRQNKETVDRISAVIILQGYLEFVKNKKV